MQLDLQENHITFLDRHSFSGLHRLEVLNLMNNDIMEIYLGELVSILTVQLRGNQIREVDGLMGFVVESHGSFQYRFQ